MIDPKEVTPLISFEGTVPSEWLDYNGHMNVAYYMHVFCDATDAFLEFFGVTEGYRQEMNCSTFVVENHVNYMKELHLGSNMRVETRLLGYDVKRMSYHHSLYNVDKGYLAATSEWISLHVDLKRRSSCEMPNILLDNLKDIYAAQKGLPLPVNIGRSIMSWNTTH
ncbi:thioesterase family protein [Kiloniella sp. EL199]|uniref:thioesterase family protein n=1 Tax=Kiloniella sp. EL199 TaxID=2107581 RepID=UPI000EA0C646|nr:thioesterase family protein [Kiloniella sp. EL199]